MVTSPAPEPPRREDQRLSIPTPAELVRPRQRSESGVPEQAAESLLAAQIADRGPDDPAPPAAAPAASGPAAQALRPRRIDAPIDGDPADPTPLRIPTPGQLGPSRPLVFESPTYPTAPVPTAAVPVPTPPQVAPAPTSAGPVEAAPPDASREAVGTAARPDAPGAQASPVATPATLHPRPGPPGTASSASSAPGAAPEGPTVQPRVRATPATLASVPAALGVPGQSPVRGVPSQGVPSSAVPGPKPAGSTPVAPTPVAPTPVAPSPVVPSPADLPGAPVRRLTQVTPPPEGRHVDTPGTATARTVPESGVPTPSTLPRPASPDQVRTATTPATPSPGRRLFPNPTSLMTAGRGARKVRSGGLRARRLPKVEETSAGGVVLDLSVTPPAVALIARHDRRSRLLWSLPKGHVEAGETPEQTALREVHEETGLIGRIVAPLGIIDFWFVVEDKRIHKTVHHYVIEAIGGELSDEDIEVEAVEWVPYDQVIRKLAYGDERRLVEKVAHIVPGVR